MVEWIAMGILALLLINFFALYRRGVGERNRLSSFIVQLLLDEEVYQFQKDGMRKLIMDIDAEDALTLSRRVSLSVGRLVNELGDGVLMAAHSLVWELKKERRSVRQTPDDRV
jgi:hypothetical protein